MLCITVNFIDINAKAQYRRQQMTCEPIPAGAINMKSRFVIFLGCLLALSITACSRADTPVEQPARAVTCMACHGGNGMQTAPNIPSLDGQSSVYLAKQLRDFQSGRRSDPVMSPLAKALSDEEVDQLAAYFASLDSCTPAGD